MTIFNSYVSLPKGTMFCWVECPWSMLTTAGFGLAMKEAGASMDDIQRRGARGGIAPQMSYVFLKI